MDEEDGGWKRTEKVIVATNLAQIPPTRVRTSNAVPSIPRAGVLVLGVPMSIAGEEEEGGHGEERYEEADVGPGTGDFIRHSAPVRVPVH